MLKNLKSKFKWPPKEAEAISKAIQDRFKARTPRVRLVHHLYITSTLSGDRHVITFRRKIDAIVAMKHIRLAAFPPDMEIVSKPKLEEGEYIPS